MSSKFKVVKEPVSYNHRLYQPGETLEDLSVDHFRQCLPGPPVEFLWLLVLEARKDEDMEGFLQAGYVGIVEKPSASRRRSKK